MPRGIIEINKLRIHAFHGVLEQERTVGNMFEVTVHLHYPIARAMQTDNISVTLDYSKAIQIIKSTMENTSQLLEHVVELLRIELAKEFPLIESGMIRVAKLAPPIDGEVESVAVCYEW